MKTRRINQKRQKRNGFSKIELLVIIIVIGLLVSLTLPAIQSTRHVSKGLSCLNNMRNIGLAVVNYSSGANSELPLLVDTNRIQGPDGNSRNDDMSWCITILPFLDQVYFRQQWDETARAASQEDATVAQIRSLTELNHKRFPFFTCSDDQFSNDPGALSYCANIGYVTANYNTASDTSHIADSADGGLDGDTTTAADVPIKFASGVFWRPHSSRMSLDIISASDGMTQTLMLTENIQAGQWYSTFTGELGFGVDVEGVLKGPSLRLPSGFNLRTARTDSRISSNLTAEKGQAWRPSSNHPSGVVNVIFCDGSGSSLSPQMDAGIYARLLTPGGLRYGQVADDVSSY
ncbi:DUF1559 domain-containing protein [uncultured Gimesia sp.]|uniref:DUF1559 family PulG-like putative transporter n=1 Tax=uncultured Gimesia sp. TaxID=1678688 RepID=UPI0026152022|nr:DUF1559 domain-containing protein [uncultured Gimesia sp.]